MKRNKILGLPSSGSLFTWERKILVIEIKIWIQRQRTRGSQIAYFAICLDLLRLHYREKLRVFLLIVLLCSFCRHLVGLPACLPACLAVVCINRGSLQLILARSVVPLLTALLAPELTPPFLQMKSHFMYIS